MQKNETVTLTIESLSSDGNGVGHTDGYAVFVPCSAVGDVAEVKLVKTQKTYAFGRIERIVTPSADRIANDCDSWPQCGGCAFRHIYYSAELAAKRGFVCDALTRIGHLYIEVAAVLVPPRCERYRNKVQFPVFEQTGGGLGIGFFASRSHRIVPADNCLLQDDVLNKIAHAVCELLSGTVPAYNEKTQKGMLRHIILRRSDLTKEIMLCLVINAKSMPNEEEFARMITRSFPEISTVVMNINRRNTNVITGVECRTVFGSGYIEDMLCGVPVRLSPLSFFQINNSAAELLYAKIKELAEPSVGDTLLDIYCGAGTIGLSMAKNCRKIIGIEVVPEAVVDAKHNAAAMGIANAEFIKGDAGSAAQTLLKRGETVDIAVVDPPRKGCDSVTLETLRALAPKKIVMVSCNPATLARDLAWLQEAGYSAGTVYPVDMFPRTRHVEAVVLLENNMTKEDMTPI